MATATRGIGRVLVWMLVVALTGSTVTSLAQPVYAAEPDTNPPVTTLDISATEHRGWRFVDEATVSLTATDTGGPTAVTEWTQVEDQDWEIFPTDFTWSIFYAAGSSGNRSYRTTADGGEIAYTFVGHAVEIYGTTSAAVNEVLIDDVSQGTYSHTAPFADQQLLFSVTGLTEGEHKVVLRRLSGGGSNFTYFDFLRYGRAVLDAPSGVATTEYRINGGAWTTYAAPFTLGALGAYTIDWRSTDVAGNVEATNSQSFRVVSELPFLGVPGKPYSERPGNWIYHYVGEPFPYEFEPDFYDYEATRFEDITELITSGTYGANGINGLSLYGPYKSSGQWRGLPSIDYYDTNPKNGSIEDVEELIMSANERGIVINMYPALIYVHEQHPVWIKAQQDRRDNIDSTEARIFRWDERTPQGTIPPWAGGTAPPNAAPNARPSQGNWAFSPVAGRWFATSWGLPAPDLAKPEARELLKGVIKFWMDRGVQGFEYDAPQSYWGAQGADSGRQTEVMITTPEEYRPDLEIYTHAEGTGTFTNQTNSDTVGFSHILVNPDDDFNSLVTRVGRPSQNITPDQLELHYQVYMDHRRRHGDGRGLYAAVNYDYRPLPTGLPARLRPLDMAVEGGMGVIVVMDQQHHIDNRSPEEVEWIYEVFRARLGSPAMAMSALRTRVPTQAGDNRAYAIKRQTPDGEHSTLNLYNFADAEKCVTVNLAGSGVTVPQRPTDLHTGQPGPWILGNESTFKLTNYGWQYLDIESDDPFPWTYIDDKAAGWTYGSVWTEVTHAVNYGGTYRSGTGTTVADAANAWGERTFTGKTVQAFGRMSTGNGSSATQVQVTIDGGTANEIIQVFSQRRPSNEGVGNGERFGRQLFSIAGLADGEHTIRIQQLTTITNSGGPSGIDYLRVSDENLVSAAQPAGGDRCLTDTTAPVSTLDGVADGAILAGPVSLTLEATDPGDTPSGVATIEYRINGGSWTEYVYQPIVISALGRYTIDYRATDVAGNVEEFNSISFSLTPAAVKQAVIDALQGLLPSGDKKTDKRISKAIEQLEKSLNPGWWIDQELLSLADGNKVFDAEKKVVEELSKKELAQNPAAQMLRELVLDADRHLALTQIQQAESLGGNQNDIDKAYEELAKGDAERAKGKYARAVDKYKAAWSKARNSIR